MQNELMVSYPDRMHKLRLQFSHEVQLLVDLRYSFVLFCYWSCFLLISISEAPDQSWTSVQNSSAALRLAHWLQVAVLARLGFFWQTLQLTWSEWAASSQFLKLEREGAMILEVCRWRANSINDTQVGCPLLLFMCNGLPPVLCWPLQTSSSFGPVDFWCCTSLQQIRAHLILRENI